MPIRRPHALGIEFVSALPMDFNAHNRLSAVDHSLNDFFDFIRNLRHGFADRSPDMVGNGNTADLSQVLIDLQITTIGGEKRKPDRSGVINKLEFRYPLIGWRAPRLRFFGDGGLAVR
jgi:hypothetical protein